MATPVEVAAMRRAIALSAAGLGTTSPNPPVGCVLLGQGGEIVGEGFHQRKGEAHAEAHALAEAGALAGRATAIVTLEPCNHQGRTPACRQALIDAAVKRVVIALIDPTSRGEGGAAALRAARVEVETEVLADEARVVLGPWLAALEERRPLVTWPYVITREGVSPLADDTAEALELRLNADAVLGADGNVTEAIPGCHGAGILKLGHLAANSEPLVAVSSLYESGIRHLLLGGGLEVAGPFLSANLVDRLLAYMPGDSAASRPVRDRPWAHLPPGFEITGAYRTRKFTCIEARQETSSLPAPAAALRHPDW